MFSFFRCCIKKQPAPNKPPAHVLMPVYNAASFAIAAIDSAIFQSYENLTLFIIDDGSTDDSLTLIKQYIQKSPYKSKIRLKTSSINCGVSQMRQQLVQWSKAVNPHAYLLWLDADDQYRDRDFISKVIQQMLKTQAEVCLFNFSIDFEDKSQIANAAGVLNDKKRIAGLLDAIHFYEKGYIFPTQFSELLRFTSLGWTKCYAPGVQLPAPINCPYEDFVYMASLLNAKSITALPASEEPVQYLRRSTSVCGQRKPENFTYHIPKQLECFFNAAINPAALPSELLLKARMAQQFVEDKFLQYQQLLEQLIANSTYVNIDHNVQEVFSARMSELRQKIIDQISSLAPENPFTQAIEEEKKSSLKRVSNYS